VSTIKVDTYLTRGGASEIAIDKLKGASSAGSMTVVGEGGSTTTNLQQGLAKSYTASNSDGSGLIGSFNVSSLTDLASGKQTTNFTNNMANLEYAPTHGSGTGGHDGNYRWLLNNAMATGSYVVWSFNSSGSLSDNPCSSTVVGDLA